MTQEEKDEMQRLKQALRYLIRPDMTVEEAKKALEGSYFRSHNSSYCDYMAGQEMGGVCNAQTETWDLDCEHKWEVARLLELFEKVDL